MIASDELWKYFGTSEPVRDYRQIIVGDLAYQLGPDSVSHISWRGHEVIRAISWPIRDSNWGTMRPTIVNEMADQSADSHRHEVHFQVGDGALECKVAIQSHAGGEIKATIKLLANLDFPTNRAGFTVLHPITGVAGSDLLITHSDGTVEQTQFPTLISPDQPVMDIVGLRHELHDTVINIQFDGEVFEMEDQRNWSDASYKTYCVPLVHPFTYTIAQHSSRQQTIIIRLSGGQTLDRSNSNSVPLSMMTLNTMAPQVGLAVDDKWGVTRKTQELINHCGVQFLLARINLADPAACLETLAQWPGLSDLDVDLEVLIPEATAMSDLAGLSGQMDRSGIHPARLVALPEPYLASHQPGGPWPEGPTPSDAAKAAREAFPDIAIGSGVLTNFTELNRCRPDTRLCDYVTHANTAIVHAADDQSVMETLEALPQVFTSTQALCGSRPCRLGLVSIGARTNPYGSATASNPTQIRQALAHVDPRQRGLFAAAWAVGALGATTGQSIEAITLAAPAGPFGIVWQKQAYPQPGFDDAADAIVFPLYHIVRAAATMSGRPRTVIGALPAGIVAYGVRVPEGVQLLLANTGAQACTLALGQTWHIRQLDMSTFAAAVRDPLWTENSPAAQADMITLNSYATAFLTLPGQDI